MFTDQLTRAIAAARTPQLDHLSAELWKAYAAGALSDVESYRFGDFTFAPRPWHHGRSGFMYSHFEA